MTGERTHQSLSWFVPNHNALPCVVRLGNIHDGLTHAKEEIRRLSLGQEIGEALAQRHEGSTQLVLLHALAQKEVRAFRLVWVC